MVEHTAENRGVAGSSPALAIWSVRATLRIIRLAELKHRHRAQRIAASSPRSQNPPCRAGRTAVVRRAHRTTGVPRPTGGVHVQQQLVEQPRLQERRGERGAADADGAVGVGSYRGKLFDRIVAANDASVVAGTRARARDEHLGRRGPDCARTPAGNRAASRPLPPPARPTPSSRRRRAPQPATPGHVPAG